MNVAAFPPSRYAGFRPRRLLAGLCLSVLAAGWVTLAASQSPVYSVVVLLAPVMIGMLIHNPAWGVLALVVILPLGAADTGLWITRSFNYALPALVLFSWGLVILHRRSRPRSLPHGLAPWFLTLAAWTFLCACFSRFPMAGFGETFRLLLLFALLLAVRNLVRRSVLGRALLVQVAIMVPLALAATIQVITAGPAQILAARGLEPERQHSIFENPNTLGLLAAHAIVILTAWLLVPRFRPRMFVHHLQRGAVGIAILALAGGLAVSFSRGSYLYATVAVCLLLGTRPVLRWLPPLGALAAIGYLVLGTLPGWLTLSLRLGAGVSSRDALWSSGWGMLRDHPWTGIGAGTGVFESHRSAYIETAVQRSLAYVDAGGAHNLFINKGAELGWLGVLLAVTAFILLLRRVPYALRRYGEGDWLAGVAAAIVTGLAVNAIFEIGSTFGQARVVDSLLFFLSAILLPQPSRGDDHASAQPPGGCPA